jgi:hypothetical protein
VVKRQPGERVAAPNIRVMSLIYLVKGAGRSRVDDGFLIPVLRRAFTRKHRWDSVVVR